MDRYTAREQAVVDYLSGVLDPDLYEVSRCTSAALSGGSKPYLILVRLLGGNLDEDTTMDQTDKIGLSILCLPRESTDDDMNLACNVMTEAIINAVRSVACYDVLRDAGGQPLGWVVVGFGKGKNEFSDLASEVLVEFKVQDTATESGQIVFLQWRERAGDSVVLNVIGLEAGQWTWVFPDGSSSGEESVVREGSGGVGLLVVDAAEIDAIEQVTAEVTAP